ncbi:hypothetical protein IFM89_023511 [Coptis chinensis]|uniref:Uncharacterized protein n=1 Tax=Coptis chinensis TaxID=261450 RepID=A0A835HF46_9MAGN|nr:hypothetical protein IFM89_023511 [Coptis chinensis]
MNVNSKVSKFGVKSGFVIPKNKLSGSLVPGKVETDAVKEESSKKIQRKTKWGNHLTEDDSVRKGRALAYQTRVEQITKQLKLGILEKGESDLNSHSPNHVPDDESSKHRVDDQKLEILESEKGEAIGEILKLNPSYKVPPDYKPLVREAKVPVPVKLYPGLNFVRLILGPESNTQKRLEVETGAKVRIQGTKAGSTEKVEITLSDRNDDQGCYEELYVHVSADTFEKVDAAVALIELLVTPVSGSSGMASTTPSSVSRDGTNVLEQSQNTTSSYVMPSTMVNQGLMQSMVGSMQPGLFPQVQLQSYPGPWFPSGPMGPPNNFHTPLNSSSSVLNNTMQFPSSPLNSSKMPQFSIGQPPSAAASGFTLKNPSLVSPGPQSPLQGFQWPYFHEAPPHSQAPPVRVQPISGSQAHLAYPSLPPQSNPALPHQPRTTGPGPGFLSLSQPLLTAPSGQPPYRPLASSAWSGSAVPTPAQPVDLFQRLPLVSQPLMASVTASSNATGNISRGPSGNMVAPASFPSRPSTAQLPNTPVNHTITGPKFSFVIHQRSASTPTANAPVASIPASVPSSVPPPTLGPLQAPFSMMPPSAMNQSSPLAPKQTVGPLGPTPYQSIVGSALVPSQQSVNANSISGSLPSFTSLKPPMSSPQSIPATAPRPQRPSSGDFTFQPLGSPVAVSQTVLRPSDQLLKGSSMQLNRTVQPPSGPSYQPALQNSEQQLVMQGFPGTRPRNQALQSQFQVPSPTPSPTHPPRFLNPVSPTASGLHMGPRSLTQTPQIPNFPAPFPPQMMNSLQLQPNQSNSVIRSGSFLVPNQHNLAFSSGKPALSPRGNQVYDPFAPTSASSAPQQPENHAKVRKQEDDPEYVDLMASVGVR